MPLEVIAKGARAWRELREEFVIAQDGQCAICRLPLNDDPHLDHCHVTGFIRGVLCGSCNTKLGWYEGKRRAIEEYLSRVSEYQAYQVAPRVPRPPTPRITLRQMKDNELLNEKHKRREARERAETRLQRAHARHRARYADR